MLTTTFSYRFALLAFTNLPPAFGTLAQKANAEKQANSVLTHLPQANQDEPCTLRLQVVSSKIEVVGYNRREVGGNFPNSWH